jgi:hypothetical protein
MSPLHPTEQHALDAVLSRASLDPAFRRALLTEPRAAIDAAFGIRIPPDLRVQFIEKGPEVDALIVLPDLRDPSGELSERDLESVAGGQYQPNWAEPFGR